jgi:hypothetical protein
MDPAPVLEGTVHRRIPVIIQSRIGEERGVCRREARSRDEPKWTVVARHLKAWQGDLRQSRRRHQGENCRGELFLRTLLGLLSVTGLVCALPARGTSDAACWLFAAPHPLTDSKTTDYTPIISTMPQPHQAILACVSWAARSGAVFRTAASAGRTLGRLKPGPQTHSS